VALYEHVEAGDYANAHRLAAVLLVASVLMLWALFRWQRKQTAGVLP
jgi:molybdate transport system permease protein